MRADPSTALRTGLTLCASLAVLCSPGTSSARTPSVFINDVRVDGLRGQTLTGVDITFDENGDIRITAKGYKISVEGAKSAAPAAASQHVYIATQQPPGREGAAQWDVDVYVNQVYVHRFRSKDSEPIFEVTKFLHVGENTVRFLPRKEAGERRSTTPNDFFELVIGDGEQRAGQIMLNRITSYRRTAAETTAADEETTIRFGAAETH
jgi:hypothetical protein